MNHPSRIIITTVLTAALLAACTTDELLPTLPQQGENEVQLSAVIEKTKVVSRTTSAVIPTPEAPYFLYYTSSSNASVPKKFEAAFTESSGVYWDDIKPATTAAKTTFQLTNVPSKGVYPSETNKDIQWGEAIGWQNTLSFVLAHRMAQLSLVLIDKTNNGQGSIDTSNPIYKDVEIVISSLSKDAKSFDATKGTVTATEREKEVVLYSKAADENGKVENDGITYTSTLAFYPPQAFEQKEGVGDSLRITCGKYTYTVEVPKTMTGSTETTTALRAGEHLTLAITLQDETVDLTATLKEWEEVEAEEMPLTRVFNIASLEELKDFALAVNTGYDFKGMIVRLTQPIIFGISDALYCFNIGTKSHPFRGIFDGNGQSITLLGVSGTDYPGSLFGYTSGATLRNLKFEAPYVKGQGVLVAEADNTVIMGCEINGGKVTASGENTGALVGKATGSTTLTNCYVTGTTVDGISYNQIGGLVGSTEGGITHCFATGNVTTSGSFVGGLAGKASNIVVNCYAWGNVSRGDYIGGLIGMAQSSIRNSYAAGTVNGSSEDKGGLLGSIGFGGDVKYCFWSNAALGSSAIDNNGGGLVDLTTPPENKCNAFDFNGSESILDQLNTGYPGVWKEGSGDKKPVFN